MEGERIKEREGEGKILTKAFVRAVFKTDFDQHN